MFLDSFHMLFIIILLCFVTVTSCSVSVSIFVNYGAYACTKRKREGNGEEKCKNAAFCCMVFAMAVWHPPWHQDTSTPLFKAHGDRHEPYGDRHLPAVTKCMEVGWTHSFPLPYFSSTTLERE